MYQCSEAAWTPCQCLQTHYPAPHIISTRCPVLPGAPDSQHHIPQWKSDGQARVMMLVLTPRLCLVPSWVHLPLKTPVSPRKQGGVLKANHIGEPSSQHLHRWEDGWTKTAQGPLTGIVVTNPRYTLFPFDFTFV